MPQRYSTLKEIKHGYFDGKKSKRLFKPFPVLPKGGQTLQVWRSDCWHVDATVYVYIHDNAGVGCMDGENNLALSPHCIYLGMLLPY